MRVMTLAAGAALFAISGPAAAATLFLNPIGPNPIDANCLVECGEAFDGTDRIGAQSFALSAGATVEALGFTFVTPDRTLAFLPGSVDWSIRSDAAGQPGGVIASGTEAFTAPDTTDLNFEPFVDFFAIEALFDIADTALTAGDYFATFDVNGISPAGRVSTGRRATAARAWPSRASTAARPGRRAMGIRAPASGSARSRCASRARSRARP